MKYNKFCKKNSYTLNILSYIVQNQKKFKINFFWHFEKFTKNLFPSSFLKQFKGIRGMESKIFFTKNNLYFKAESTNLKPVFVELKNLF